MKILDILQEATDISDFGRMVYREAVPNIDKEMEQTLGKSLDGISEDDFEKFTSGNYLLHFRRIINKNLSDVLRQYVTKEFGSKMSNEFIGVGKLKGDKRVRRSAINTEVFTVNISDPREHEKKDSGWYDAYRHEIVIMLSDKDLKDFLELWITNYINADGGNKDWNVDLIKELFDNRIGSTLMHEVTHFINDIMGETHQNTAYLKHGKGYFKVRSDSNSDYLNQVLKLVGSNIFHLSRTSEIQTFASQIAWGMAKNVMTAEVYDDLPSAAIEELDDMIEDLAKGYKYYELTRLQNLITKTKEVSPNNKKNLEKIWKRLLKNIVKNLEMYKEKIKARATS